MKRRHGFHAPAPGASIAAVVVAITCVVTGCSTPRSTTSGPSSPGQTDEGDLPRPTDASVLHAPTVGPTLTEDDRAALLRTMREAAPPGFEPLRAPPPTGRDRWSDVPAAVALAAERHEMAITSRRIDAARATFTLRTIDDRPVRLDATMDADGTVRFEAVAGLFGDRRELADALAGSARTILSRMAAQPRLADALRANERE